MKKHKQIAIASAIAIITLASLSAHANTRLDQVMWTDRGAANPPLSDNTSTITESIERFWNLPIADQSVTANTTSKITMPNPAVSRYSQCAPNREGYRYNRPMETHTHTVVTKGPNHTISQHKNQRDKRGYFGINLFNIIPLIDIVSGSSETTSSDHVEASR